MAKSEIILASNAKYLNEGFKSKKTEITAAMPQHVRGQFDRIIAALNIAVYNNDQLKKCTAESILIGARQALTLGLDPSGTMGQAYLVPFWNSKKGVMEAKFMPGYRGLIDLARRSGQILTIVAREVYAGEDFQCSLGTDEFIRHNPDRSGEIAMTGEELHCVYAVATLTPPQKGMETTKQFDVMYKWEINRIRDASKGYLRDGKPQGPWHEHYIEMAKKTVIKRLIKTLPISIDLAAAMEHDDALDNGRDMITVEQIASDAETETKSRADTLLEKLKSKPQTQPEPTNPEPTGASTATPTGGEQDSAGETGSGEAGGEGTSEPAGNQESGEQGGEGDGATAQPEIKTHADFKAAFEAFAAEQQWGDELTKSRMTDLRTKTKIASARTSDAPERARIMTAIREGKFNWETITVDN